MHWANRRTVPHAQYELIILMAIVTLNCIKWTYLLIMYENRAGEQPVVRI